MLDSISVELAIFRDEGLALSAFTLGSLYVLLGVGSLGDVEVVFISRSVEASERKEISGDMSGGMDREVSVFGRSCWRLTR